MIVIPNKNKDVFICFYNVNYETETYNTKVLNSKGDEILKQYNKVEPIENYSDSEVWYEPELLKYEKDGKYGLIDFSGKKILDSEYDNIYPMLGIQKSIIVEKESSKGIVNSGLAKLVAEPKYSKVESLTHDYSEGYIITNAEGTAGVFGSDGKIILECEYDKIQNVTGNNMFVVSKDNKNIVINKKSEEVLNVENKTILSINNNNLIYSESNKFGVINIDNEKVFDAEYDYIKFMFDKYYIAKKDGKYGVITVGEEKKLDFLYNNITYIENANIIEVDKENNKSDILNNNFEVKLSDIIVSEIKIDKGYLRIRSEEDYKYYNFKFEEKTNFDVLPTNTLFLKKENGKYGYVNSNGEKIVDSIYDDAKEQNEYGYCAVKKDGLWGCIKSDGTIVVKPSINLENNLYIDFISEWYLYEDMRMNTYIK